jgi:flagella basal body P-ring formation protein FlgA
MILRASILAALGIALGTTATLADTLVAARNLRAQTVITSADLGYAAEPTMGAVAEPSDAIGLETRVTIFAGRPIMPQDLGPAALIDRNQIIVMIYNHAGLEILTDGRALDRGGIGDRIRVMNMTSRSTVTGRITESGTVEVR